MSPRSKPPPLRILVDRREQQPLDFAPEPRRWAPQGVTTEPATLATGDYTTRTLAPHARCERKAPSDFYSSLVGENRERFDREMVRLARFRWGFIIVECGLANFLELGRFGLADPASIVQSIASFYARHGVATFFMANRETAAEFLVGTFLRCEQEVRKIRRPFAMWRRQA